MNSSGHLFAVEACDHPFDLSPVAELQDIAGIAAAFGARRGLKPGIVPEPVYQVGSIGKGAAAGDEERVHDRVVNTPPLSRSATKLVNARFTMIAGIATGAGRRCLAWRATMKDQRISGGFFLMVAILLGFGWGVASGDPTKGAIIGATVGCAIALAVWLKDRSRT